MSLYRDKVPDLAIGSLANARSPRLEIGSPLGRCLLTGEAADAIVRVANAGVGHVGEGGLPLGNRCARCGVENPAGKKFCGDCGADLSQPTAAPQTDQSRSIWARPSPVTICCVLKVRTDSVYAIGNEIEKAQVVSTMPVFVGEAEGNRRSGCLRLSGG